MGSLKLTFVHDVTSFNLIEPIHFQRPLQCQSQKTLLNGFDGSTEVYRTVRLVYLTLYKDPAEARCLLIKWWISRFSPPKYEKLVQQGYFRLLSPGFGFWDASSQC